MRIGLIGFLTPVLVLGASGAEQGDFVVRQGDDWVPIEIRKDILKGSALDFSMLGLQDAPAGKYGQVRNVDGHFEFEKLPGRTQRFYGINLCFSAAFPDHGLADELAERLARNGYNAVRLHHYERQDFERSCVTNAADGRLVLDAGNMDRLDYLCSRLIQKGIYLTTDLYTSRRVTWKEIGETDRDGMCPFKTLVHFHPGAYSNWCAFAELFLGHRNPYTGRTYAEEPALLFLPLINEGRFPRDGWDEVRDLPCVRQTFAEWIHTERTRRPGAYPEVKGTEPPSLEEMKESWHPAVVENFQAWSELRLVPRLKAFLRDRLNCRALISNINCSAPASWVKVRSGALDLIDNHGYVDHPSYPKRAWGLPIAFTGGNPLRSEENALYGDCFSRVFGKPYTETEWNWCYPGAYRAQSGLVAGSLAALQDWSGMWRFGYAHKMQNLQDRPLAMDSSLFDIALDPVNLLAERAGIALFLRGDLKRLGPMAVCVVPEDDEYPAVVRSKAAIPDRCRNLIWRTRVGTDVGPSADPRMVSFPLAATNVPELVKADHRQAEVDLSSGRFVVRTERTAGGYAEQGLIDADCLRVTVRGAPAAVWATSLEDRGLRDASRLVLFHVTDVQNSGASFNAKRTQLTAFGSLPLLARTGEADIELQTSATRMDVYAVDLSGRRLGRVPAEVSQGILRFRAAVNHDGAGVFVYEISRNQ